jgi:hypothetical protein
MSHASYFGGQWDRYCTWCPACDVNVPFAFCSFSGTATPVLTNISSEPNAVVPEKLQNIKGTLVFCRNTGSSQTHVTYAQIPIYTLPHIHTFTYIRIHMYTYKHINTYTKHICSHTHGYTFSLFETAGQGSGDWLRCHNSQQCCSLQPAAYVLLKERDTP